RRGPHQRQVARRSHPELPRRRPRRARGVTRLRDAASTKKTRPGDDVPSGRGGLTRWGRGLAQALKVRIALGLALGGDAEGRAARRLYSWSDVSPRQEVSASFLDSTPVWAIRFDCGGMISGRGADGRCDRLLRVVSKTLAGRSSFPARAC